MLGPFFLLMSFIFLLFLALDLRGKTLSQENELAQVRQAIQEKNYSLAIDLCLQQLLLDPENFDFNFLLSQAYAFSGQWDKALGLLNHLADRFPHNVDVLIFRARLESWKKNYSAAEVGYKQALEVVPNNLEAMIGLAEIASWQSDFSRSISIYQQVLFQLEEEKSVTKADILFRIGRVYFWSGNYQKAREYLRQALAIDQNNEEYKRILKMAQSRWQDKYEFRYEYQRESFSDGRAAYVDDRLALQVRLPQPGPLVIKANRTKRFDRNDHQLEAEFYPRLWSQSYAYLQMSYSSPAIYFPQYAFTAELYHALSQSWDISAGFRRLGFSEQKVMIYLGSLGRYFGPVLTFLRWYYTPRAGGSDFSWTANLRRYFSTSNYLFLGYGQGSRPFELVTLEDYRVERSWVFFAGADWALFDRLRLQFNFTHRDEGNLKRNLFFLSAGFRW